MTRLLLAVVLSAVLLPALPALAFDADKPDAVAVAFLPFEPEREEDAAISFLLEDYVQANLTRRIRHPVHMGPALQPALMQGTDACAAEPDCIMLLGAQFNASLVVRSSVFRSGSELQLETEWFTTGNGLRVGRERVNFEPGQERAMVDALTTAFETYFDTSLRVTGANRAGEGGIVDDVSDQEARAAEYRERSEKRVSSRRRDFDSSEDDSAPRRADPAADLRAAIRDDDDAEEEEDRSKRSRTPRRREDHSAVPYGGMGDEEDEDDEGSDDLDEPDQGGTNRSNRSTRGDRANRSSRDRSPAPGPSGEEDDLIDLDADDDRGRSVATYADAQRQGYSRREYNRYAESGRTFSEYQAARWSLGKRVGVKVGGVYGVGYLIRRYASTTFVQINRVKTDEWAWERLGFSPATGGFDIGIMVAPADVFGIEADFSLLIAQQDLRREYLNEDGRSNIGEVVPEVQPTAHVGIDITARAFLFPRRRIKLSPGFGLTFLVMAGYDFGIPTEDQLAYTPRPATVVIGVTPVVGIRVAATPYIHIYVDLSGTAYVDQGDAYYEEHQLFGTVTPRLTEDHRQIPLPVIPLMARLGGGVQLLF